MRIAEKAAWIVAAVGYVFLLLFWRGGGPMIAVSLLLLSGLYFFLSFSLLNGIKLRNIFRKSAYTTIPSLHIVGAALTGFVLFQTCLGLIFGTLIWTGYKQFLLISIILCVPVVILSIAFRSRDKVYYYRILTRVIPLAGICIVLLLFSPRSYVLEMLYHNHPSFIDAQERSWKDPSDRDLRNKAREEWQKMYKR